MTLRLWDGNHLTKHNKMIKHNSILFLLLLLTFASVGQSKFFINPDASVFKDGNELELGFAGGLNNPQFSDTDLNNDGIKDLVIFDKSVDRFLTFINNGTVGEVDYTYAPEYEIIFPPEISEWALFFDYNNDGLEDIFCNYLSSIRVYKAKLNDDTPTYDLVTNQLKYTGSASLPINIYCSSADVPAFVDVNNDGDIDVLTFDQFGGTIEYFENQSQENGYDYDSLYFERLSACWGNVFEDPNESTVTLGVSCRVGDVKPDKDILDESILHPGSTLLALDPDDDGDTELLIGDISSSYLTLLNNEGSPGVADILSQDATWPSASTFVDQYIFPASFMLDVNNDGLEDIIAAPNETVTFENHNQCWLYLNEGSSTNMEFDFNKTDFLVGDMLDAGDAAHPTVVDFDGDGWMDIVVGNFGYFDRSDTSYMSSLSVYRYNGDSTNISFEYVTDDLNNLSSLEILGLYPAFEDLDRDGDMDMIAGDEEGYIHFFENTAGTGNTIELQLSSYRLDNIFVGKRATPTFYDYNEDGKMDLVIGERTGTFNLCENTTNGAAVSFELVNDFWGEANVQEPPLPIGYSTPVVAVLDSLDNNYLVSNSFSGHIYLYTDLNNSIFTLVDSLYVDVNGGGQGGLAIADFNKDGYLDMIMGNKKGGLHFLTQDEQLFEPPVVIPSVPELESIINIYPNPTMGSIIKIDGLKEVTEFKVLNLQGQLLLNGSSDGQIDLGLLSSGIYFLQLHLEQGIYSERIIVY